KPIDWIVIRNRLTTLYTKNKRDVSVVLEALAKRIGFRLGTGFCERVIFKELFLSGLTLLDLDKSDVQLNISHVAARQELRELISFMKLPSQ
ncbi:MAG: division plane positioning ATPase MipZ, partial [Holosporaceae bacterium]|nr:division plane positioning ATPase MipZ [Holosporaceae bacterium]